jgi:hypothetical protein
MPLVPFEFDPLSHRFEEADYLTRVDRGAHTVVSWPAVGATLITEETKYGGYVSLKRLPELNGPAFRRHGDYGYSVGQFHEFFIAFLPSYMGFKFGDVEVTLGQVTPLGVYLFNEQYDDHIDGGCWEGYSSVRVLGASAEAAELYLINGCVEYYHRTGILPETQAVRMVEWHEDEGGLESPFHIIRPCCAELEPTRFYYMGLAQQDDASACLYFYRVLEFFAFLSHQSEFSKVRHNSSVSDRDFLNQAAALLSRDEKGPIMKIIVNLTTKEVMDASIEKALVDREDATLLAMRLYEFRNAVVHAKYDQRTTVYSQSMIPTDTEAGRWRESLRKLAWSALDGFGRRLG